MPEIDDALLVRYIEEISYLRSMGGLFAVEHPKLAANLELSPNASPDPHVERLIESFALLTARIQNNLAADFPEIAAELLQALYPHYLNPIPPMTIVQFRLNPRHKLPEDAVIPRGTPLFIHATEGQEVCRFRTSYAVELLPVEVVEATVANGVDFGAWGERRPAPAVLRLRLATIANESGEVPFETLNVSTLRFFIHSETMVNNIYPLLLDGKKRKVAVVAPDSNEIPLDLLEIGAVGFEEDEGIIESPDLSHPAYRLLQEYFAFEQKFHFFEVKGLTRKLHGTSVDLLFLLEDQPALGSIIHRDAFVLGCTPAVNLFDRTSEPIRVNHQSTEYRLVADYRHYRSTVIHSIRSVSGSSNAAATSREYAPFYSFTHHMERTAHDAFWHSRREGSEIFLSFHDASFNPALPGDEVVFAHIRCTNGDYAAQIDTEATLQSDENVFGASPIVLYKPTQQLLPPAGGDLLWRLISHLSLNYLSISGDNALGALREILMLYCPAGMPAPRRRIDGIRKISSRKVTHRAHTWRGFARGTEIGLVFDAPLMANNGFLFGSVLSRFFGLHASINSFSQLVVHKDDGGDGRSRGEKGMRWPMMPGAKPVL
jgi:type VI secretion system protein ImpG